MKVLIDTNIIIHREASRVINPDIGHLFNWLDKLHVEKCFHPLSLEEIEKYKDKSVVETLKIKISNYQKLKTISPETEQILKIRETDKSENDKIDTSLLKELLNNRVDFFITEDRKIHQKATSLGISERVFTIDSFIEKAVAENPTLKEYKVLSVKKEFFGNINLNDSFFDSFKKDYKEFENWFNKKSDNESYVCVMDGKIEAFLYLKPEGMNENYNNITPALSPKKRLKIGTFKVHSTGFKLGERFIKIIFDNAIELKVDEIYLTIFNRTVDQKRLISLIQDWGFYYWGEKKTENGIEEVYVRDFTPRAKIETPKLTFPYIRKDSNFFIVPIMPEYHTNLLPDSILNNESPKNFTENEPFRNAIQKVYISRSVKRDLKSGDVIVFYRTKHNGPAIHTSVVTTIGIVESVITNIKSEDEFIEFCRKRSVFSNDDLKKWWNYKQSNRPFIVNFLFVCSLPKRLTLNKLIKLKIIAGLNDVPRGFEPLTRQQFGNIVRNAGLNESYFVD